MGYFWFYIWALVCAVAAIFLAGSHIGQSKIIVPFLKGDRVINFGSYTKLLLFSIVMSLLMWFVPLGLWQAWLHFS